MTTTPRQLTLNVQLNDEATFSNFWLAAPSTNNLSANALCVSALKNIAAGDGAEWFGYVWGASGSGRSHLLQASCLHALKKNNSSQYLPLHELKAYSPADLFEGLEQLALVVLDDVDAVLGNRQWEDALFHLFNRIKQAEGHLLVGAECAPQQLQCGLPDLQSRLAWGTVYRLELLKDDEKAKALQHRAGLRGMDLNDEVAQYVLSHGSRAPRDLFALLEVLDQLSLAEKRKLTVPFVKGVLERSRQQ